MYPRFIELHTEGVTILMNVDHIIGIVKNRIATTSNESIEIEETYEEIKDLIKKSGCQIDKRDPRMNTKQPLSMDELCKLEMVGEPVWNSNTRKWMLVIDSALDNRSWVDLVDIAGKVVRFDPHDVQRFPLYRMRND